MPSPYFFFSRAHAREGFGKFYAILGCILCARRAGAAAEISFSVDFQARSAVLAVGCVSVCNSAKNAPLHAVVASHSGYIIYDM